MPDGGLDCKKKLHFSQDGLFFREMAKIAGTNIDDPATTRKAKSSEAPKVATERHARISGLGQPQYLRNTLDVQRIQNALRSAERGDTWILFTLFRDMYVSNSHIQAEWAKRKLVITGSPETLIPHSDDKEDVKAGEIIADMIDNCRNWYDALNHLLDATLYPLAAAEKIVTPVGLSESTKFKHPLRYTLKEIAPIDPTLLCFKLPYVPGYTSKDNPAGKFNPDDWESWLRFYATNSSGMPQYSMAGIYSPDPDVHIIHRGNMLSPMIPPNFGGHMRALMFWDLLATQDRDWWALLMQKYQMPIPVMHVNTQQPEAVAYAQQAMALCQQLGGLIVDTKATVDWAQVAATDSSNAHKIFKSDCNDEMSKIIIGQTLSANPKNTGQGSGASAQSEEIRDDIREQDTNKLSDTLERQLFRWFLDLNGCSGHAPHITWGGMREGAAATFSKTLAQTKMAGLRPTKLGIKTINEKFGIEFETDPDAAHKAKGMGPNAQDKENNNPVKY